MKAIIMAAGKGTRMEPLTCNKPKPMIKIANKPFITYIFDELANIVNESIVIIHKKDKITPTIGNQYKNIKINYVIQEEQLGTGHALFCAKNFVNDRFILLNGDDVFSNKDIAQLLNYESSLLSKNVADLSKYGAIYAENNHLEKIIEKPSEGGAGLANVGAYVLGKNIFSCTPKLSPRGEYEVTDLINEYALINKIHVNTAKENIIGITYPWDVLKFNQYLLSKMIESKIEGQIGKHVEIDGLLVLGKNSEIKGYCAIQGPCIIGDNCEIGPRADIRKFTCIGDNCRINGEVKNSIFYDNSKSGHAQSSILDSIIGENSNIGAGTITANLRHDNCNVKSLVKGKLIDTELMKLGAIIGDNVHTGIHTSILPGRKIWAGKSTYPNEIVDKDKI